jgi:hypothetical protein
MPSAISVPRGPAPRRPRKPNVACNARGEPAQSLRCLGTAGQDLRPARERRMVARLPLSTKSKDSRARTSLAAFCAPTAATEQDRGLHPPHGIDAELMRRHATCAEVAITSIRGALGGGGERSYGLSSRRARSALRHRARRRRQGVAICPLGQPRAPPQRHRLCHARGPAWGTRHRHPPGAQAWSAIRACCMTFERHLP